MKTRLYHRDYKEQINSKDHRAVIFSGGKKNNDRYNELFKNFTCKSIFILTCTFLLLIKVPAQIKADFSAASPSGCPPLLVDFTDESVGKPDSWKWDLGNGTISYLKNPSTTYFLPGQYKVSLIAGDINGSDSIVKEQFITVYNSPVVSFKGDYNSLCLPLPVNFTDMSTPGDGEINSWKWDFGDGTIDPSQNPLHTYTLSGTRDVTLEVTNSVGCSASAKKINFISIPQAVIAGFTNTTQNSCKPPLNLNFSNTSSGPGKLAFQWNFGDNNIYEGDSPAHVFTKEGEYKVQLKATSLAGCTNTIEKIISIGTVVTDFSPLFICPGKAFIFSNLSKPASVGSQWYFGDATSSTESNPVKTFKNPGTYNVKLVTDYGACKDSVTKPFMVIAKPSFTADDTIRCSAPFTVKFKSNLPPETSQLWDFGDGVTSSDKDPSHTYTTTGNFDVRLTSGCGDISVRYKFIRIKKPVITLPGLPVEKCIPYTHSFSASVNSEEKVTDYLWNFGDGTSSAEIHPSHTYTLPGKYTVTLTITTVNGCVITSVVNDAILAGIKPAANFIAPLTTDCASSVIKFNDLSTGDVNGWEWDFGDMDTSHAQNPVHAFRDTGYFDITLIAKSNGCPDTIQFQKYVYILPALAKFRIGHDCAMPKEYSFENISKGGDTWQWDFGDETMCSESSPSHVYANDGVYTITLNVTNDSTGCNAKTSKKIEVYTQPKPVFTADKTVICTGASVVYKVSNINPAKIVYYYWDFGNGVKTRFVASSLPKQPSFTFRYDYSGIYTVRLIITNIVGCSDTVERKAYIKVGAPIANFSSAVKGTCLNNIVDFKDSSTTVFPLTQWQWDYGDGISEKLTSSPFAHLYNKPGTFSVTLKLTDSLGCTSTQTRIGYITIAKPEASFSADDTISCPSKPIFFKSHSTGSMLSYRWYFGDGNFSAEANPIHPYSKTGTYTVSLKVTDQYGCTDSSRRSKYIVIVYPSAGFTMSDSISSCPPFFVDFKSHSSGYSKLRWDFGDGNISSLENPVHSYTMPGTYTIKLIATSPGGCTDIKTNHVTVNGPTGLLNSMNKIGCDSLRTTLTGKVINNISFTWDFDDGNTLTTKDSSVSHSYITRGTFIPKMILEDSAGCKVSVISTDTIKVVGIDAKYSFKNSLLCDSGLVSFKGECYSNDVISQCKWDWNDGSISFGNDQVHQFKKGLYHPVLTATTSNGCVGKFSGIVPVKVESSPKVDIIGIANGCTPLQQSLKGKILVQDTSAIKWHWTFDNGVNSDNQDPPPISYKTSGVHAVQLEAVNSIGCSTIINKTIEAYAIPAVNAGADTFLCNGRPITLHASGAEKYVWSPANALSCTNCADPSALPATNAVYVVKGTSAHGCIASDTVAIDVKYSFKMSYTKEKNLCKGSNAKLNVSGASSYEWKPSVGSNTSNPVVVPDSTTTYRVIGSDEKGCFKDTGFIKLVVYPIPTVDAGPDKTINVGKTVDLIPVISNDVTEVIWSPTGSQARNIFPGITVKPLQTTEYTVEVSNPGKCNASDRVKVMVLCNGGNAFVPNTFSPNGDGTNDVFYPRGTGLFKVRSLKIFSRWGEKVFENDNFNPNDPTSGWNGTYKGKKLTEDVFVYMIDLICENNQLMSFNGNVFLAQ